MCGSNWVPALAASSASATSWDRRFAVGAVGAHRVPGVAAGDDARFERDRVAGESVGVAGSVPALVVGADDQTDVAHEPADAVEHLLALDACGS